VDVIALLDRLENLVASSARVPLTGKIIADEEAIYNIIDDIRHSLPDELKQAKMVVRERDRLLEQAKMDAEQIITEASNRASRLAEESSIVTEARRQAQEIVDKAKVVAQEIVDGAKLYAHDTLTSLSDTLARVSESVKQGQEELRRKKSQEHATAPLDDQEEI